MKLDETLFEDKEVPAVETEVISDSEIEPEGPEQGEDTGIANLIHDLIIDENEAIQGYNNAAANMEKYPELQKIMQDIASEEFAHIGELQKALEVISPNAAKIAEGEVETEDNLDQGSPVDESLNESLISSFYLPIEGKPFIEFGYDDDEGYGYVHATIEDGSPMGAEINEDLNPEGLKQVADWFRNADQETLVKLFSNIQAARNLFKSLDTFIRNFGAPSDNNIQRMVNSAISTNESLNEKSCKKFSANWKNKLEESLRLTEDKDSAWNSLDIEYKIMLIMNFYKDYIRTNGARFWEDLGEKYADAAIDDAMLMEEIGYFHILPSMEAKSIYGPNSKPEDFEEEEYTWGQAFKDVFDEFGGNVKKLIDHIRRK